MKNGFRYRSSFQLLLVLLAGIFPASVKAGFTNSATLTAKIDGTNLVVAYSLTSTQGWVTLFQADRPEKLGIQARPVDLAAVPASGEGQFRVPLDPGAPPQLYQLLIQQWLTRGKGLVFVNGPLDFDAMRQRYGDITNSPPATTNAFGYVSYQDNGTNFTPVIYRQPQEVWLDELGVYDQETGTQTGGNDSVLKGRYLKTNVRVFDNASVGDPSFQNVHAREGNDFRINYLGDENVPARQAIVWTSEVQMYYDVTRYRTTMFNDAFINELFSDAFIGRANPTNQAKLRQVKQNLLTRQYRPDLDLSDLGIGGSPVPYTPALRPSEEVEPLTGIRLYPLDNAEDVSLRTRDLNENFDSLPPLSIAYDSGATLGDYAGLMAFWVLGTNKGFQPDAFYGQSPDWQSNVLSPLSNGLSAWVAFRYTGAAEIYRFAAYSYRVAGLRSCGGTGIPGDKGWNIRNVMMFDEQNTSHDGVFPFTWPSTVSNDDGPVASDLAAQYIAAILYDMAFEAGLGVHKTDLLLWATVALIYDNVNFPMRALGAKMQEAARALWPDPRPNRAGLSVYEEDVVDVLTSRGIPMNGVADFRTNLPAVIGDAITLEVNAASGFGTQHPELQPSVDFYGHYVTSQNGYMATSNSASYFAYQFYKHSKYGPCDKVALTDGTFNVNSNSPFEWSYNGDGAYYTELEDRQLGNLVLMVPGTHVHWLRSRQRCPDEATGFYAEDVRPFGFRVIKATPNGFSFTVARLSETETNKTYALTIVDPSLGTLGPATYAWAFEDYAGNVQEELGSTVHYTALKDQPFTVNIARSRGDQTDTLTLRERGNDFDRDAGNAFLRNLIPPTRPP